MSQDIQSVAYLIIDWGTTNFRAFAMNSGHQQLDVKELNMGLLQVQNRQFAERLEEVLQPWLENYKKLPIYMAGMVGSAKGWVNVDYAATNASINSVLEKAHYFTLPWGANAVITPGVCHRNEHDQYDVMRGEEIQLFGLQKLVSENDFQAILPGTHSKHAEVKKGEITQFSSYLTGECFSVLVNHTLLGKGLELTKDFDKTSFFKGVKASQDGAFTNRIFLAWTTRLFNQLNEQQTPDYLSGLLIGYELRHLQSKEVYIVGGGNLCQRYQAACDALSINHQYVDGNDCFLAGMVDVIKGLN